jgi:IS5 family transposase
MMLYFRKRLPKTVVSDCNERIVRHGLKVICSSDSTDPGDESGSAGGSGFTGVQRNPSTHNQPN